VNPKREAAVNLMKILATALGLAFAATASAASAAEPSGAFEKVHCLKYAGLTGKLSMLVVGATPDVEMEHPMVVCVAEREGQTLVLDAGFSDKAYGEKWGVTSFSDLAERLTDVGVKAEDVDLVTLGHLHWDHAGGTSRFPNARFVVQRRELEFAAVDVPGNAFIVNGFRMEDVVDVMKLKWAGRIDVVDGDAEDWQDGIDLYLTPGHTAGTMTVCLATVKGRVCYTSDAVYSYRNLEENLPLGIAVLPQEMYESFAKIRRVLRGGRLVPGHDVAVFDDAKARGFRRVSDRVVAIVE
jgi:glyoxylase-like metal-dependent hydrolase (beta-lactamase superfamily II)